MMGNSELTTCGRNLFIYSRCECQNECRDECRDECCDECCDECRDSFTVVKCSPFGRHLVS